MIIGRMMINELAKELNNTLSGTTAGALLSDMGLRLYFPNGIIAQGGEAAKSASFANGTIGMAVANGTPIELDTSAACFQTDDEKTVLKSDARGVIKTKMSGTVMHSVRKRHTAIHTKVRERLFSILIFSILLLPSIF